MSDKAPTFRWSNACVGGPRATSKLPFGPLAGDDLKKMGLVGGVCTSMGSMYCFTQCDKQPHEDCPVVENSAILAEDDSNCGTPCQTCMLECPCKVQIAVMPDSHYPHTIGVDLAEQEDRTVAHLTWWDEYCKSRKCA